MTSLQDYVPYKSKPEWSDVTPVPQDDCGRQIVKIAYSDEFIDVYNYFRAVLLKDEHSERALQLSADALILNPANYTAWEYRRRIIDTLSADLKTELQFLTENMNDNTKNYQVWHHREWLIDKLAKSEDSSNDKPFYTEELNFARSVIEEDPKNYHAWQHLRWLVIRFKIPHEGELIFTEKLINEDVYNNSAWSHRFTTVTVDEGVSISVLKREIEFAKDKIRMAPENQSSWNYLYGLIVPLNNNTGKSGENGRKMEGCYNSISMTMVCMIRKFAEDLAADSNADNCSAPLSFLVQIYAQCIENKLSGKMSGEDVLYDEKVIENFQKETVDDLLTLALNLCERLSTEVDRIRRNYWQYRARQFICQTQKA